MKKILTATQFAHTISDALHKLPWEKVIALIEERDKLICDQQKDVCADHGTVLLVMNRYNEIENPSVNRESILNAPYPEGVKEKKI